MRSLVALLVAVGRGRRNLADMSRIVEARDRAVTPSPAPPQGLILWAALYERSVGVSGDV